MQFLAYFPTHSGLASGADLAMPTYAPGFNRILDDLARRQLVLDFQFGSAGASYEAVRSIGAGAFGIVCEAHDNNTQEKVLFVNQKYGAVHNRGGHSRVNYFEIFI